MLSNFEAAGDLGRDGAGDTIHPWHSLGGSEHASNVLQVQTGASLTGRSRLANATDRSTLPEVCWRSLSLPAQPRHLLGDAAVLAPAAASQACCVGVRQHLVKHGLPAASSDADVTVPDSWGLADALATDLCCPCGTTQWACASIHSLRQPGNLQLHPLLQGVSADDVPAYTGADDWGAGGGSSDDDTPEPAEPDAAEEAGPSQQAPAAAVPEPGGPSQQPASPPARRPRHPAVQRLTKQQSRGSLSGVGSNSSRA